MKERRIKRVIPSKSNRTATIRYSKRLYRQRNCERVLGHLKINRAIATRYDQLAESFLGMLLSPQLVTGSNLSTPPSKKVPSVLILKFISFLNWHREFTEKTFDAG